MSNVNYELSSVTELDFPEFDEYDIISGSDFSTSVDGKTEIRDGQDAINCHRINLNPSRDPYSDEWDGLFGKHVNLDELKKRALTGELRTSRFRSICWRCLLGILHTDPKQWPLELTTYRRHYNDLWVELEKNPWNVEGRNPSDNPLSQEAESIWQKYFSNEELKSVIYQDVVRTFPGVNFFRKDTIQELMVRILFCYAKQNPLLCYRQGMHEILAPLIFVLHCDHQALEHYKSENTLEDDVIHNILDPAYIEEDAYSLFKYIMNHIESSYRINNMVPTSTGYFTPQSNEESACENEVIKRLQHIKDNILQASDPDLSKHLDELDVPLHLFGIRWLRLLFGREFPFQDLLILWDSIFAVSHFELVDYIVVAMLTAVRSILLGSDYTTCLTNLMRYPLGIDVMFIIEYALHLMSPVVYPTPTVASIVSNPVALVSKMKASGKLTHTLDNSDVRDERLKGTSPSRSPKWTPGKSNSGFFTGSGDGESSIVEGYTLDDPKVLKSDLDNLTLLLSTVHSKLSSYHSVLSRHFSSEGGETGQALDGLHELCTLLKAYQTRSSYGGVEAATEAGETRYTPQGKKKPATPPRMTVKSSKPSVESARGNTLPKTGRRGVTSGELQVFRQCEGGSIVGAPMTDPLRVLKDAESLEEPLS